MCWVEPSLPNPYLWVRDCCLARSEDRRERWWRQVIESCRKDLENGNCKVLINLPDFSETVDGTATTIPQVDGKASVFSYATSSHPRGSKPLFHWSHCFHTENLLLRPSKLSSTETARPFAVL